MYVSLPTTFAIMHSSCLEFYGYNPGSYFCLNRSLCDTNDIISSHSLYDYCNGNSANEKFLTASIYKIVFSPLSMLFLPVVHKSLDVRLGLVAGALPHYSHPVVYSLPGCVGFLLSCLYEFEVTV